MKTMGHGRIGYAAFACLMLSMAAAADLPFAYLGPDVPSLAGYTLAEDDGGGEGDISCFLVKAARFGGESIEFAQIAMERAPRTAVRRFAAELAKSQAWMNAGLAAVAERRGVRLPCLSDFDRRAWMRKTPEEFERDCLARLIELHELAAARFEAAAQQTDDEVADCAAECLPCLRAHLRRLQELAAPP